MKRTDVIPLEHTSDIPGAELYGLTWDELMAVFKVRYRKAGQPQDKLVQWLNRHEIGARSRDPEQRVLGADWWSLCSLVGEARVWVDEAFPPRSDLA